MQVTRTQVAHAYELRARAGDAHAGAVPLQR